MMMIEGVKHCKQCCVLLTICHLVVC